MNSLARRLATGAAIAGLTITAHSEVAGEPADLILHNATVYTADKQLTTAEALAIRDGRITSVGSDSRVLALRGPATQVHNLQGAFVMPGLHDSHIHALGIVRPDMCDLDGESHSLGEIADIVRDCLAHYRPGPGEWLPVLQWDPFEGNEPSDRYPTIRAALDSVSETTPIILWGNDGHHGAVNSAALQSPPVPLTADTLRGHYAKYRHLVSVDAEGEPSGTLTEEARLLLRSNMDNDMLGVATPAPDLMPRVAAKLASRGITSIQDAAVTPEILEHYRWLEQSGGMTFRLRAALVAEADPELAAEQPERAAREEVARLARIRDGLDAGELIRADALKIFVDGVLEGNPYNSPPTLPNAAVIGGLLQPRFSGRDSGETLDVTGYVDPDSQACREAGSAGSTPAAPGATRAFQERHGFHPNQCQVHSGELAQAEPLVRSLVQAASQARFHVHAHTVSDRAVRVAADAFEAVRPVAEKQGLTQSIAHMQLAHPDDLERLGSLGAFVSATYLWAVPDPGYEMTVIPFIDRIAGRDDLYNPDHYYVRNAYPFRRFSKAGGTVLFGSDAPVGKRDPRPFQNMEAALSRAQDGLVLNAGQKLEIHEALASYTRNAARFMAQDDRLGTLAPGKVADIVVLDRNPVRLAEQGDFPAIGQTRVLMTLFAGQVIYTAD